jgi:twinkle protein
MSYAEYGITIPNGKYSGEVQTTCPACSHTRKKKTDKCLSINLDKKNWYCHHCSWKGALPPDKMETKTYIKPEWKNRTKLSDKVVEWFSSRGIGQQTLNDWKISEGLEFMPQDSKEVNTIQFNYFDQAGELINVKYRTGNKHFKLHKGSQLALYGLNMVSFYSPVFLTEGEIDCLTLYQSGVKNVLSVPNGANPKNNNLEYFEPVAELFEKCPEVILCLDNDAPGRKLREDLAERIGKDKCKYVEFKDCKDANECLMKYGVGGVNEAIQQAKEFPLEGVFTVKDIEQDIDDMYVNGLEQGLKIGHPSFDLHLSFVKGYLTIITGIPGHGKSDFLDEITLRLLYKHGWKTAYYSPENRPTQLHFSKLARKLTGKSFSGDGMMSHLDLKAVKGFLNNKFWFIKPEKDFTLDSILSHVKQLKSRFGCDSFVIDAWNKLEHKYGQSETKYIGESLDKLTHFCEVNMLHCFLVAHPTKIQKDKNSGKYNVPSLYDISGSSNFFNKADNGLTVYRDFEERKSTVYIQKVKFSHWGQVGMVDFTYDLKSGRYIESTSYAYSPEPWIQIRQEQLPINTEFLNETKQPAHSGIVSYEGDDLPF